MDVFLAQRTSVRRRVGPGGSWPLSANALSDVGAIFSAYARLYPGMKSILDISNEQTVEGAAPAMLAHMDLHVSDPRLHASDARSLAEQHGNDRFAGEECGAVIVGIPNQERS